MTYVIPWNDIESRLEQKGARKVYFIIYPRPSVPWNVLRSKKLWHHDRSPRLFVLTFRRHMTERVMSLTLFVYSATLITSFSESHLALNNSNNWVVIILHSKPDQCLWHLPSQNSNIDCYCPSSNAWFPIYGQTAISIAISNKLTQYL